VPACLARVPCLGLKAGHRTAGPPINGLSRARYLTLLPGPGPAHWRGMGPTTGQWKKKRANRTNETDERDAFLGSPPPPPVWPRRRRSSLRTPRLRRPSGIHLRRSRPVPFRGPSSPPVTGRSKPRPPSSSATTARRLVAHPFRPPVPVPPAYKLFQERRLVLSPGELPLLASTPCCHLWIWCLRSCWIDASDAAGCLWCCLLPLIFLFIYAIDGYELWYWCDAGSCHC
jgi:hypothetical protein